MPGVYGFGLGLCVSVKRSARERAGRDIREHPGEGHTDRDQQTVDACELSQCGVACTDCAGVRCLKTHLNGGGSVRAAMARIGEERESLSPHRE
jgi:hypothetical protein